MCTVPLLRALRQNITVQFNVQAEMICYTIPLHILINPMDTDVQFNVLVEVICQTIPFQVLINSADTL